MSSRDDLPRGKNRALPASTRQTLRSEEPHRAARLCEEYPRPDGRTRAERERVNVLFVCSRNQWRSPTAERVFRHHPLMAVRSAGTSPNARRPLGEGDLRWADVVMVMEPRHRDRIRADYPHLTGHVPIHVLDIPDDYRFMDPELVEMLEAMVPAVLFDHAPGG